MSAVLLLESIPWVTPIVRVTNLRVMSIDIDETKITTHYAHMRASRRLQGSLWICVGTVSCHHRVIDTPKCQRLFFQTETTSFGCI